MIHTLFSFVLAGLIVLSGVLGLPSAATATRVMAPQSIAALPGFKALFAGTPPENLGVHDGKLSPCPDTSNCVVSQGADTGHAIAPITYTSDRDTARNTLLRVLSVVPRTSVVEQTDDYIRFESASRLMGFVDDGEFYFSPNEKVIHVRSAARLGESDLGVNRRRIEQIRLALADLGI